MSDEKADKLVELSTTAQTTMIDTLDDLIDDVVETGFSGVDAAGCAMSTLTLVAAQTLVQLGVHPHVFFQRVAHNVNEIVAELKEERDRQAKKS